MQVQTMDNLFASGIHHRRAHLFGGPRTVYQNKQEILQK